jgi:stearoyl-CoA desaturase (delta-9 desaturase)
MTSSPLQWAVAHYTHHKFSDTAKDPHNNSLAKYFGVAYFTKAEYDFTRARKLMRDPLHQFLHRYYLAVHAIWATIWYAVGGWSAVYCAWVAPAVFSMWVGAHHTRKAHQNGVPVNMPFIFGFLYLGEHLHREHHSRPRLLNYATEAGQIDLGYQFIRLIRRAG